MKFLHRFTVPLVVVALLAIAGYEAYWLRGLYKATERSKESILLSSLSQADASEMMTRINVLRRGEIHGEISVGTSWSGSSGGRHNYTSNSVITSPDGEKTVKVTTVTGESKSREITVLDQNNNQDTIPSATNIALIYQQGLHTELDKLQEINVAVFDSLLTEQLELFNLNAAHQVLLLKDNDTVSMAGTEGYSPSSKALSIPYQLSAEDNVRYELKMEPLRAPILKDMIGVIGASVGIFLIIAFAFWFLLRMMKRQQALDEMKSDFTGNITHELKTPIAVAYAANDAMLNFGQGEDPENREKYLKISQEQLEKLGWMVERILSMTMENRKGLRLDVSDVKVKVLLEKVAEQARLSASKDCTISVEARPESLTAKLDRRQMSSVVSTLVDNSLKYSGERVDITLGAKEEGGKVLIWVKDNGIGIAADKQKLIFDKFYRVPTGNVQDVKGYGIGLFFAKTIVGKHGGTISVVSGPGKGSVFTISLPGRLAGEKASNQV